MFARRAFDDLTSGTDEEYKVVYAQATMPRHHRKPSQRASVYAITDHNGTMPRSAMYLLDDKGNLSSGSSTHRHYTPIPRSDSYHGSLSSAPRIKHKAHRPQTSSSTYGTAPRVKVTRVNHPISTSSPALLDNPDQKIDMAISNFQIRFDREGRPFKPGEEIVGKVIMDVWAPVEVRFVELVILGKGTIRVFKDNTFTKKPKTEVYLDKKIMLIAPNNGSPNVVLSQGHYVSNFRYKLPDDLPPTVNQFEVSKGHIFDITYTVQAHVCNSLQLRQFPGSSLNVVPDIVRVLKAVRRDFGVLPARDWPMTGGATHNPIVHAEQVRLFCNPFTSEPTSVLVNCDKAVYPRGDNIKVLIEVLIPSRDKVKEIGVELQQKVTMNIEPILKKKKKQKMEKLQHALITVFDNMRNQPNEQKHVVRSSFTLPVPTNIIPSHLPQCTMVDVTYQVHVVIQFKRLGGELTLDLPIIIAPEVPSELPNTTSANTDPIDRPIFNKPVMQFPYFSKAPSGGRGSSPSSDQGEGLASVVSERLSNGRVSAGSGARTVDSMKVTSKYQMRNKCCDCWLACFGMGMYRA